MEIKKIDLPNGKTAYIIDNVLPYHDMRNIYVDSMTGSFTMTQKSEQFSSIENTRLSRHIENDESWLSNTMRHAIKKILKKIFKGTKLHKKLMVSEMYINMSDAMTATLPHTDRPKGCWTLLYYPNIEWDIKWGGQTNFIDENTMDIMQAVIPKPGRFILFEADILHQATPPTFYAAYKRVTIATKLDPIPEKPEPENIEGNEYVATNTCWQQ